MIINLATLIILLLQLTSDEIYPSVIARSLFLSDQGFSQDILLS